MGFNLGATELAVLGCFGAVVIGAIVAGVVFAFGGKDREDE